MSGMQARRLGLLIYLLGAAVAWFMGLQPLLDAQAGAAEVTVHPKAFLVAPMAMMCGLFMLVGGGKVGEVMMRPPSTPRDHLIVWPMFVTSLAAGGGAWWWMEGQIAALGYVHTI